MSVYIKLTSSASAIIKKASPTVNDHSSVNAELAFGDALLVSFPALAAQYRKRRINYVALHFSTEPEQTIEDVVFPSMSYWSNAAAFAEGTVTYATAPAKLYEASKSSSFGSGYFTKIWSNSETARTVLLYGARIEARNNGEPKIPTSRGARPPDIGISLSDDDIGLTPYGNPASGYISKNTAQTFSWTNSGAYDAYTAQSQTAAVFHWRNGTSGAWTNVSLTTAQSATLAQGSLTGSSMQWYVTVTSSSGVTTDSEIYTLSTAEVLPVTTPISPVGEIVDGTQPAIFTWSREIETGTAQTAADLQISTDGETWSALGSVSGAAQSYTVPANTLTAGSNFWRVRSYNQDNAPGDYSEPAQIIVVAPSGAPNVSVSVSPLPTVSWTATGQEGYEVELGEYTSGQIYGTAQSWTPPDYLPDGTYTARVRVVNIYGLWSPWGGAVFNVTNTPGNAITLTAAQSDADAELSWSTSGYDIFYIYRDGVKIGETDGDVYADRFAPAGEHEYQVRGVIEATHMYGLSDTAELTLVLREIVITDPETDERLYIRHCLAGKLEIQRTRKRAVTYQHYRGFALPEAEIAPDEDETYTFAPVFLAAEKDEARAFEGLIGRVVHLRDIHGAALFGVIDAVKASVMPKYTSYAAAITAVAYEGEDL